MLLKVSLSGSAILSFLMSTMFKYQQVVQSTSKTLNYYFPCVTNATLYCYTSIFIQQTTKSTVGKQTDVHWQC